MASAEVPQIGAFAGQEWKQKLVVPRLFDRH
jgi:hypothetical protein